MASVVAAKARGCTLGFIGCARRVLRQGADTQLPLREHWKFKNNIGRQEACQPEAKKVLVPVHWGSRRPLSANTRSHLARSERHSPQSFKDCRIKVGAAMCKAIEQGEAPNAAGTEEAEVEPELGAVGPKNEVLMIFNDQKQEPGGTFCIRKKHALAISILS